MKPIHLFIASVLAFFILYFGFSKVSPEIRNPEKSGTLKKIDTDFNQELRSGRDSLNENDRTAIDLLDQQFEQATSDSLKISILQRISGFWYQVGNVGVAAEYARKLAESFPTGERWAIAATNFILAAKQPNVDPANQLKWIDKAKDGFTQAQNVEPGNISHQVNLALVNVEYPPQGQPMTGILQLRKLNETYPENTLVLFHLARLAIQTNQWDKAKERLNSIIKLDPGFSRAYCLMMDIAKHENDEVALKSLSLKCKENNQ